MNKIHKQCIGFLIISVALSLIFGFVGVLLHPSHSFADFISAVKVSFIFEGVVLFIIVLRKLIIWAFDIRF